MVQGIILAREIARVTSGVVHIDGLTSCDPEVASLIAESDDPEIAVRRALYVGARALRAAQTDQIPVMS